MTVSSTTDKVTYNGDGSTAAFSFPFQILDEDNILAEIKDSSGSITAKTITSDYTVSGTGNRIGKTDYTSGTVTFTAGNIPSATDEVIISRDLALTQETDYTENGVFPAESNETALDKLTLISQSLNEVLDRSLKFDAGVTSFDVTFPSPEADKFFKINASNNAIELSDDTSIIGSLSKADGTFYVGDGSTIVAETGNTARTSLALGTGNTVTFGAIEDTNITNTSGTDLTVTTSGGGVVKVNTLTLNGNTIASNNTNGAVELNPNGTGEIQLNASVVTVEQFVRHSGDANNQISFGTDTQDIQTGGSSRLDISNSGVRLGGANSRVTTILDEDGMVSDSATALSTQQSIKAYVDSQVGGGASADFTVITADPAPAVVGGQYACDTSSSGFTVTLPASPTAGTSLVRIMDYTGTFGTNSLTIGRNGNNIMGLAQDMTVNSDNAHFTLIYIDATEGWRIF